MPSLVLGCGHALHVDPAAAETYADEDGDLEPELYGGGPDPTLSARKPAERPR